MKKRPCISIIVAMARNRVIGHCGGMPWHLSEDLRRFRQITWGKPVLMGRKTHEAIGRPLPGRHNIVVSRSHDFHAPGCTVVDSLAAGIATAEGDQLMVIGGAMLYEALLPQAEYLYLTWIEADFPGDTFFPEWDPGQWREVSREQRHPDADFPYSYRFLVFQRRFSQDGDNKGSRY